MDQVVRRLLQPDPGGRFASAAETGRTLAAAFATPGLARRPLVWAVVAAAGLLLADRFLRREGVAPPPRAPIANPAPRKPMELPPQRSQQAELPLAKQGQASDPLGPERKQFDSAFAMKGKAGRAETASKLATKTNKSSKVRIDKKEPFLDTKGSAPPSCPAENKPAQAQVLPRAASQAAQQASPANQAEFPARTERAGPKGKPSPKWGGKKSALFDDLELGQVKK